MIIWNGYQSSYKPKPGKPGRRLDGNHRPDDGKPNKRKRGNKNGKGTHGYKDNQFYDLFRYGSRHSKQNS